MFFLGGYGTKAKRIGNFGIRKCANCNNFKPHGIFEISKQASMFFVSVAKWNKEYYVVCPVCQYGIPIINEKIDELLRLSLTIPGDEKIAEMWHAINTLFEVKENELRKLIGANSIEDTMINIMNYIKREVGPKYSREQFDPILNAYIQSMLEGQISKSK